MWVQRLWKSELTLQEKESGRNKSGNALGGRDICNKPLRIDKIWQGEEGIICRRNIQSTRVGVLWPQWRKGLPRWSSSLLIWAIYLEGWFGCMHRDTLHKIISCKGTFSYLFAWLSAYKKMTKEEKEEYFYHTNINADDTGPNLIPATLSQHSTVEWPKVDQFGVLSFQID